MFFLFFFFVVTFIFCNWGLHLIQMLISSKIITNKLIKKDPKLLQKKKKIFFYLQKCFGSLYYMRAFSFNEQSHECTQILSYLPSPLKFVVDALSLSFTYLNAQRKNWPLIYNSTGAGNVTPFLKHASTVRHVL